MNASLKYWKDFTAISLLSLHKRYLIT